MISHLDEQIGRILAELDRAGLAGNTLVIFSADNGLAVGCHGLLGKMSMYDHSVRVPLVLRLPSQEGARPGTRRGALCYLYDLFPTVCDLAGIPIPDTVGGRTLRPLLRRAGTRVRDTVFAHYRDVQRMARTRRWKLIHYPLIDKTQLFDLDRDPDEMEDLAGRPESGARLEELRGRLVGWQREVGDRQGG